MSTPTQTPEEYVRQRLDEYDAFLVEQGLPPEKRKDDPRSDSHTNAPRIDSRRPAYREDAAGAFVSAEARAEHDAAMARFFRRVA